MKRNCFREGTLAPTDPAPPRTCARSCPDPAHADPASALCSESGSAELVSAAADPCICAVCRALPELCQPLAAKPEAACRWDRRLGLGIARVEPAAVRVLRPARRDSRESLGRGAGCMLRPCSPRLKTHIKQNARARADVHILLVSGSITVSCWPCAHSIVAHTTVAGPDWSGTVAPAPPAPAAAPRITQLGALPTPAGALATVALIPSR